MIATLTLNPAIDKSTDVQQVVAEKKLRCTDMVIESGGGGINVTKAICELGGATVAVFPHGGINGELLIELLKDRSAQLKPVNIKGNTRESIVINELSTNLQYKFIMPGPVLSQKEQDALKANINELKDVSFLVCSGSVPPGLPDTFISEVASIARSKGIKFIVDTSGSPLKAALEQGVYMIKPNMSELCFLSGRKYIEIGEIDMVVEQIISEGLCEVIVLSMGPSGAMLATKTMKKRIPAPAVKKMSTVGAGDSMLAGIVWMLEQGKPLEDAVRFGVACGTAATVNRGTQLFKKDDAFRFFDWIKNQL